MTARSEPAGAPDAAPSPARTGRGRPWWAWPITLATGAVVMVLAPVYGIVEAILAVPSVVVRAWARGARAGDVGVHWCDERWRMRHRAARRVRQAMEQGQRWRERTGKRLRRGARRMVRIVFRDTPRAVGRSLRRLRRTVLALAGGVKRRMFGWRA